MLGKTHNKAYTHSIESDSTHGPVYPVSPSGRSGGRRAASQLHALQLRLRVLYLTTSHHFAPALHSLSLVFSVSQSVNPGADDYCVPAGV